MTAANDKLLLQMCVAKRLLNTDLAKEVFKRAPQEVKRPQQVLIDMGLMTVHTVTVLQQEVERSLKPQTIAGFEIVRKLGQGGMATVYLARQLSLGREVALKLMSPQIAASPDAAERFLREARVAAVVNHPNIVSVIDVGRADGQLFMALELVTGGDAAQLAERFNGVLPEARALEILCDCAAGLAALSEARLVHRDLKPANIFLTKDGIAKLGDLGLARSERNEDRLTITGMLVGTPAFMSPEQASGASDLDIRSDIYSLGATLYALTTGEPPFTGNGPLAVVAKALTEAVVDPRVRQPALTAASAELMLHALAKRPEERFQTPQEFRQALLAALAGLEVAAASDGHRSTATRSPLKAQAASDATLMAGKPPPTVIAGHRLKPSAIAATPHLRHPAQVIAPVLIGVAVMIVVGVWMFSGRHISPASPSVAAPNLQASASSLIVSGVPAVPALHQQTELAPIGREALTPAWAKAGGEDAYGHWADLRVGTVVQRLRWMKPGTFTCGSPPTDPNQVGIDNPSRVTLSRGFWLADSECTQDLWLTMMGSNPARHNTSLQLPVEQVAKSAILAFSRALEKRCPGITVRLPSRAEWEYACRAGTTTKYWCGDDPLGLVKIGNVADLKFIAVFGGTFHIDR